MRKRLLSLLLLLFLGIPASLLPVSASSPALLSPALQMIADKQTMVKSGLVSGVISFSPDDFTLAVGSPVKSIVLTALPAESDGTLMLGNAPACVNQVISAAGLSQLRFVASSRGVNDNASFRFRAGSEYSLACSLKYTDSVNQRPVTSNDENALAVWTQQDIAVCGTLSGSDPDGDRVEFEIVSYPEHGILTLTDASRGNYCYTPCDGILGSDRFVYRLRDEWGNYSEKASVSVEIDKAAAQLVFADMDGHWAHNAALVMASEGAMQMEMDGDLCYFRPDETVTREDFLVTVMKSLGAGTVEPRATVFADNNRISEAASGYIARAYELGVIKGVEEDGLLCFHPEEPVTRAEAAVILNAIIGAEEPDIVPVFADNSSVPAWAQGSLYALSEIGIFQGNGSGNLAPNDILNRAETAQILMLVKKRFG